MNDGIIRTNDGVVLKDALRKSERRQKTRALALVAPLGIFLLAAFIIPIGLMLFRSVDNRTAATSLHKSHQALADWKPDNLPSEETLQTVANEIAALRATGGLGKISQRLNRFYPGIDSAFKRASKELQRQGGDDFKTMDKLVVSAYDYADLSNRLWQLRSEHSRLSHATRIYNTQASAIKSISEYPQNVSAQTASDSAEFLSYLETALELPSTPKVDKTAGAALIDALRAETKGFPAQISKLEIELAEQEANMERLKAVLGTSNTAAAALANEANESSALDKPVTQTQSEEYRVNVAQRKYGQTRAFLQAHIDLLTTIDDLPGKIDALYAANQSYDGTPVATIVVLKARGALARTLSAVSQKGEITDLDARTELINTGKSWIAMRAIKPLDETNLKNQAYEFFGSYPYLENSKYDSYQALFTKAKKKTWTDPAAWAVVERLSKPYVADYFLRALDLRFDTDGSIVREPENRRVFLRLLIKTIQLSAAVAFCCLLLGYPLAYLLATLPTRTSNMLMIFVLLPFWTSLLVRTTAWLSILSREGVVNNTWVWIQKTKPIITMFGEFEPWRFEIAYTWKATLIAMVHILLPFMILPVFSVMKNISPTYMRAGRSLGATGFTAFRRVYFPQTLPGIGAGALLVFILAIGYFITPALVGGADGVLISNMIQTAMQRNNNPQLAAASGSILLILVLFLYWAYNKIVGINSIKFG